MSKRLHSDDDLIAEIETRLTHDDRVVVVSFDGRSGAGKSTLASIVAFAFDATVIQTDDFFAAEVSNVEWDRRSPEQRAADAIDWRRLRRDVIEPLRKGLAARWFAFDFAAGTRADGTYPMQTIATNRSPTRLVFLDGVYSSRPELADVIDLSVLVEITGALRRQRLAAREDAAFLKAWHARWDCAEAHYFDIVRPPASFDIVFEAPSNNFLSVD